MIATLVSETTAEWQLLEKQVQAGRWTTARERRRLRELAVELGVALQVKEVGVVP